MWWRGPGQYCDVCRDRTDVCKSRGRREPEATANARVRNGTLNVTISGGVWCFREPDARVIASACSGPSTPEGCLAQHNQAVRPLTGVRPQTAQTAARAGAGVNARISPRCGRRDAGSGARSETHRQFAARQAVRARDRAQRVAGVSCRRTVPAGLYGPVGRARGQASEGARHVQSQAGKPRTPVRPQTTQTPPRWGVSAKAGSAAATKAGSAKQRNANVVRVRAGNTAVPGT